MSFKGVRKGGAWVKKGEEGNYQWVRKDASGRMFIRRTKPRAYGIARAKQIHAQRPKSEQLNDEARRNKRTVRATEKNLKTFKKRPGSMDIKGVDSKRSKKKK
jgi:hypothetical protein